MHRRRVILGLCVGGLLGGSECGPSTPTSLVPANYRATFVQVRNCRSTIEHVAPVGTPTNTTNIVVYINPESASAYMANQDPLPANTLVIKEEHDNSACTHAIAWSVSHKEPGFDPTHGDWHWQHVLLDGTLDADGRDMRCSNSSCHGASVCLARDWMCTDP